MMACLGWVRWAKEEGGVGMNQVSHNLSLAIKSLFVENASVSGVCRVV